MKASMYGWTSTLLSLMFLAFVIAYPSYQQFNFWNLVIDIESRSTVAVATREEINKNLFRSRLDRNNQPLDKQEPNYEDPQSVIELIKRSVENNE